ERDGLVRGRRSPLRPRLSEHSLVEAAADRLEEHVDEWGVPRPQARADFLRERVCTGEQPGRSHGITARAESERKPADVACGLERLVDRDVETMAFFQDRHRLVNAAIFDRE